ncbi:MAG: GNAT family N-acetyltransferase [Lachnospiraceae bacterium]|nr:GNAT family N-acetyltransferase [Lachnospiraceae bacterium]
MSITFTEDIGKVDRDELNALYGVKSGAYELFENSFIAVVAIGEKVAGAVRVLSEGVETALLTDLRVAEGYDDTLKEALVHEAEKKLAGRRVMVFGSRDDLGLFEELGYGRCKNAWTYYRSGMSESDFLPAGYRFENEFAAAREKEASAVQAGQQTSDLQTVNRQTSDRNGISIEYRVGYENTTFEDINTVLTKAFGGRPHDVNRTKAAFSNSSYSVTAYDGKKLVGVARAVADAGSPEHERGYATILNVAVDPGYQGLSIGKNLVLKLSGIIDTRVIVLNTHPGAVGFYNKLKEYRRNKYVFEKFLKHAEADIPAPDRNSAKETDAKSKAGEKKAPDWAGAMFTPKGYRYPDEY